MIGDILAKRRDRVLAIILSAKEREVDGYAPREASDRLRKVILDQVNELTDLCLDMLKTCDVEEGVLINEEYLERKFNNLEVMVANLQR